MEVVPANVLEVVEGTVAVVAMAVAVWDAILVATKHAKVIALMVVIALVMVLAKEIAKGVVGVVVGMVAIVLVREVAKEIVNTVIMGIAKGAVGVHVSTVHIKRIVILRKKKIHRNQCY